MNMNHYNCLVFLYSLCCSALILVFSSCSVEREQIKDISGMYCASAYGNEFSEYTILRIKEDSIQMEVIIPTVGQNTYYGEGVITKRTKQKIKFKFTPRNNPYLESLGIYDLDDHYYLKGLQKGKIMLCYRCKGKILKTILHTGYCDCLVKEEYIESYILKTRKNHIPL